MIPLSEKPVEIEKNLEPGPLNFSFLREKGVEFVQQLSGKSWTDFNLHDPGVTILECLCFAITDLAYRTDFPITDIVTNEKGVIDREKNSFFPKEEILSSNPVTPTDFRKIVIDLVPEVCNVWLHPVKSSHSAVFIKGLYNVTIQPTKEIAEQMKDKSSMENDTIKKIIEDKVKKVLASHRTVGEDFESYKVLEPQSIYINEAEIIIRKNAAPEILLATICHTIETAINPQVSFLTEQKLKQTCTIDEIYAGPLLKNGIITDTQLSETENKLINVTNLIKAVSEIEGVVDVRELRISNDKDDDRNIDVIEVREGFFPFANLKAPSPNIKLYNENYLLPVNIYGFQNELQKLRHAAVQKYTTHYINNENGNFLIAGSFRNLQEYTSIQTLFPDVYNIGKKELEKWHSNKTVAVAKQLKAYVMFFEQVLINYLSQLANIDTLLSPCLSADQSYTYFSQMLDGVPGAKDIISDFNPGDGVRFDSNEKKEFNKWLSSIIEPDHIYKDRKKNFLNHMLARFNVFLNKYPVTLYRFYYDKQNLAKRIDAELEWKANILKNIVEFNNTRAKAFDYLEKIDGEEIKPGLERNISLLLHIKNITKIRLSSVFETYKKELGIEEKKTAFFSPSTIDSDDSDDAQNSYSGELLLDEEEMKKLEGIEENQGIALGKHPSFSNQNISFFQFALDKNNYRIGRYTISDKKEVVTLYNTPGTNKWKIISAHATIPEALSTLKKTIDFLIRISTESEGFHLIEHVLLRPSLNTESFGFNFHDEENKVLFKGKGWQHFDEREHTISRITDAIIKETEEAENDKRNINNLEMMKVLLDKDINFHKYHDQIENRYDDAVEFLKLYKRLEDDVKKIVCNINHAFKNKKRCKAGFEHLVRLAKGSIVREDFFHFQMTAVFPSWPARFQDKGFREFTKNLLREECPAHIKVNILWLNKGKMKEFEDLYFSWLQTLQKNASEAHSLHLPVDLILFLKDQIQRLE